MFVPGAQGLADRHSARAGRGRGFENRAIHHRDQQSGGLDDAIALVGLHSRSARFDALRLLRRCRPSPSSPRSTCRGHEQLRVSRLTMDVVGSGVDYSTKPEFTQAVAHKVYYGPVYFRRESEPYMTLSLAGTRRDTGVSIAQVNLKLIWDVVSKIKVGQRGRAYVVDAVRAASSRIPTSAWCCAIPICRSWRRSWERSRCKKRQFWRRGAGSSRDITGATGVLTAYAQVYTARLAGFCRNCPSSEAYAPLYRVDPAHRLWCCSARFCLPSIAGMFLARRMVGPIQALRSGAARIGLGRPELSASAIKTGDEARGAGRPVQRHGRAKLQESYADLEQKVEEPYLTNLEPGAAAANRDGGRAQDHQPLDSSIWLNRL